MVKLKSMDLVVQPCDKAETSFKGCGDHPIILEIQEPKIALHGKTLAAILIFIRFRLMFHVLEFATVCDNYVRGVDLNRVAP